jgi:predicted O-methyltransferase YrrM
MINDNILNFWEDKIGHLSKGQAEFILGKLEKLKPSQCLEIGFAGGRHTYCILEVFAPEKMVSLDINFDYQQGRRKIDEIKEKFENCVFIEQDSKRALTEEFMSEHFPEGIDYVFVDGGHHYNDAISDMRNVFPFLKDGGIMIVDDYQSKVCPLQEVDRAVRDFSAQSGNPFETVSLEDGKGMAVFVK